MAKYLRVCSDLHLEAFYGRNEETLALDFLPKDDRDVDSILILAGDISSRPEQLTRFLAACLARFEHVLYVPGNHEYYRQDFHQWNDAMDHALLPLVSDGLMFATRDIKVSERSGIRFIYGTMWADGGPTIEDQAKTGFYLNDFRLIRNGEFGRFTVPDMMQEFRRARNSIEEFLSIPYEGKKVVVTHHLPSRRLVSARFWPGDGSDGANGGFVGNCDLILARTELAPQLWIHGHTHDTIDTKLWDTRIVCNPAAYRGEWHSPHNQFWTVTDNIVQAVPKFIDIEEI